MRRTSFDDREFSEINITPLTDVVFVLLLVFMVATPALVSRSLPVAVPDAASPDETPTEAVTISLDAARRVYLEDTEVPMDSLALRLGPVLTRLAGGDSTLADSLRPSLPVVVRADTAARHGDVVRVLSAIRTVGGRPVLGVEAEEAPQ